MKKTRNVGKKLVMLTILLAFIVVFMFLFLFHQWLGTALKSNDIEAIARTG